MSETRETVEKLKLELREVRAAAGAQRAEPVSAVAEGSPERKQIPKSTQSGRARGKAARAVAIGGSSSQISFDLTRLGLKEANRTEISAAVQTTRAIIAEYA